MAPRPRTYDVAWQIEAACRRWPDPDAFFPDRGVEDAAILLLCSGCPVAIQCRTQALRERQRYGVWGGLTERDRERIWEQRAGRRDSSPADHRSAS